MRMEVRALFGRNVWCIDITNNCLNQHHRGFWVQAHIEGVRTQPGRTRFTAQHLRDLVRPSSGLKELATRSNDEEQED